MGRGKLNAKKPSKELSLGEILSLTFNLYSSNFLQFFLPFVISGIIMGISSFAITSSFPLPAPPDIPTSPSTAFYYEVFLPWFFEFILKVIIIVFLFCLLSWIVGTPITSVVIKSASDQIEKGASNLGASFNFVISKLPSLLAAQFVAGILMVIGLFLFIVPGIIFALMFSLVIPTVIVEQKDAFESLGRSKRLVSHRWLKTFALLLVLSLIVLAVTFVAGVPARSFEVIHPILNPIVTNIISAFISPIYPIAITYLYYAMVARENPQSTPPPAPVF